jgi:hypothetical protein
MDDQTRNLFEPDISEEEKIAKVSEQIADVMKITKQTAAAAKTIANMKTVSVYETKVSETVVTETKVSETKAPDTKAPEAIVYETKVSETAVSEKDISVSLRTYDSHVNVHETVPENPDDTDPDDESDEDSEPGEVLEPDEVSEPNETLESVYDFSAFNSNDRYAKRIEPAELAAMAIEDEKKRLEHAHPAHKPRRHKRHLNYEEIKARRSMFIIAGAVLVVLYLLCMLFVNAANKKAYEDIEEQIKRTNTDRVITAIVKTDISVSASDKKKYGLSPYKVDTDGDGLTDLYELQYSATAPIKADTDGDGVPDGIEKENGLDPLVAVTDGNTPDNKRMHTYSIGLGAASVRLAGDWQIFNCEANEFPLSLQNMPGVVSPAIELILTEENPHAVLEYDFAALNTAKWGSRGNNGSFAIYKYNPEDGSMELAAGTGGTVTDTKLSVRAESGVYFAADKNILAADVKTNIMFVIDNSGSMYSSELVTDSEENDLEFKRLDFAKALIDDIGDKADFGVGKFTLRYTALSGISEDDSKAIEALESIRNGTESFDGTEISRSIVQAASAFDNVPYDRNFIILITDGLPTTPDEEAEENAAELCEEKNISVITVGLGKKIDSGFLSRIAASTGGVYYQAVNNSTFSDICKKVEEYLDEGSAEIIQIPVINTANADGAETSDETANADVSANSDVSDISNDAVDTEPVFTDESVILLADSGFDRTQDMLKFYNVKTANSTRGSALGLAIFASKYYSGTLALSGFDYDTNSLYDVDGYNLREIPFFADGKQHLSEFMLPTAERFTSYLKTEKTWDYSAVDENGLLPLSEEAVKALEPLSAHYDVIERTFEWEGAHSLPEFLGKMTFQPFKPVTAYNVAVLDIDKDEVPLTPEMTEEFAVIRAVNYYNYYDNKGGVFWLSFTINGQNVYSRFVDKLTTGTPAVLVADGKPLLAERLYRSASNPRDLYIECTDPADNSAKYIKLYASKLIFTANVNQYEASMDGKEITNLYLMIE